MNKHDDTASTFIGVCNEAGWFELFDRVHSLYLSPQNEVRELVHGHSVPIEYRSIATSATRSAGDEERVIFRSAMSKNSVACLTDLQWPDGCSLENV